MIIKECAKSQVSEIRVGALHLVFGKRDHSSKPLEKVETKPLEQEARKISEEATRQERIALLADELEMLKLEDPLSYEKVLGGDIEDGQAP